MISSVHLPEIAFGKQQWETYLGQVEEEPALPENINQILESTCPFDSSKTVKETHMLVFIPSKINLNTLEKMAKAPLQGRATQYRCIWESAIIQYNNQTTSPHWVLMHKKVIPLSLGKGYQEQQLLIEDYNRKNRTQYQIPSVLEVATCSIIQYVKSQEKLFEIDYLQNKSAEVHCQEKVQEHQIAIGYLHDDLHIHSTRGHTSSTGATAVIRF